MALIIHADDFGMTVEQSKRILACSSACGGIGALNSTSMVVNSPALNSCVELVKPHAEAGNIALGLHLNLVEGFCCAPAIDVPLLVSPLGYFNQSFASLLALSRGPSKDDLREQLVCEITAQIELFCKHFPEMRGALRIDSHQHFHAIPLVLEALLEALQKCNCTVSYMRIPAEPVAPFKVMKEEWVSIPKVNMIKNALLNKECKKDIPLFSLYRNADGSAFSAMNNSAVFYGLLYSGCMNRMVNPALLDAVLADAQTKNASVEILFHPGGISYAEECLNPSMKSFVAFYQSPARSNEASALAALEQLIANRDL